INGMNLIVDLPDAPAGAQQQTLQNGVEAVRAAVRLLNSNKISDHLVALHLTEKAELAFGDLPSSGPTGTWAKGVHQQISLVYANAALEVMRDALVLKNKSGAQPGDQKLMEFLAGSTLATGKNLTEADDASYARLMSVVRGLKADGIPDAERQAQVKN